MTVLPEPPAAPAVGQADRNAVIDQAADQMLTALNAAIARDKQQTSYDNPDLPSWSDGTRIGDTPPVPQPDKRIVPAWAAGTAVAGIGVGAAFVGVGCGVWLACQGFAAVSLTSVLFVTLPIAGLAAVIAAIGSALRSLKNVNTEHHHHYKGPVHQKHTHTKNTAVWVKNTNQH